jgi:hypothetical protein
MKATPDRGPRASYLRELKETGAADLQSAILFNNAETDVTGADGCVLPFGAEP